MARRRRIIQYAMVVGVVVMARAATGEPTFVVHVENRAVVSDTGPLTVSRLVIRDALAVTTAIYAAIDVKVVWLEGSADVRATNDFTVLLLSGEDQRRVFTDTGLWSKDALGFAPPSVNRVYVFCERIDDLVRKKELLRFDNVLGRVIAHELGHRLLPGRGHAATGIMSANVDYRSPDTPKFTAEQGASIRALLAQNAAANARHAGTAQQE